MTINSMTGFARFQGHTGTLAWTWEVRSVNAKGRDLRLRLPPGMDGLESEARARAQDRFQRGSLFLNLNLVRNGGGIGYRINDELLDRIISMLPDIRRRVPDMAPPSADGLLGLRGVIEPVEESEDEEWAEALRSALLAGLDEALSLLAQARKEEGTKLKPVLEGLIDTIADLCAKAESSAGARPEAIKARLYEQMRGLLEGAPLPEERLVQEAALLASKGDVREEIDRLGAHIKTARELMAKPEPVGRKLDFLCQEFNREANTLCSKSQDVDLTRIGLDLKAAIEQFREQVQNIE